MVDLSLIKHDINYFELIAKKLKIGKEQVANTCELLKNGATVPFISRYRKEKTGSLNEEQVLSISEQAEYYSELEERKVSVLRRIEQQNKLTPELRKKIEEAVEKIQVEDLYAPFKFKKQTRASKAKEAGLEPLARILEKQESTDTPEQAARPFLNEEKEIKTEADALQGARDILAEEIADNADWKAYIRGCEREKAVLISTADEKHKGKPGKFEMYHAFKERVATLPSHRILAIRRGEKEGFLKTVIDMDDDHNIQYLKGKFIISNSPFASLLAETVEDAYRRLMKPSIESEMRRELKIKADDEAFKVFQKNLRDVLLAPPARGRVVLGVDPGFKSGTKLAIIDSTGKFLDEKTIYPLPPQSEKVASKTILLAMVENFKVDIIAIGNGTASREIDEYLSTIMPELEKPPIKMVVSEAGASVYSASTVAREEFPDLDVTVRGAISIARRIQDPLAELVKIDPKSIGIGQYQHDVNQPELKKKLVQVVESCVNSVGVEINTASESLLNYVSGINKTLVKSIVKYREKHGPFSSRSSMVKVPQFGPKAFEQAAGFLRIPEAENPLDATAVHPESYEVVKKICEGEGTELKDIIRNRDVLSKIELEKYTTSVIGLPTLRDIISELEKPSRDPRKKFVYANFNPEITKISDLKEGMWIEGVVSNVTDFGVFVDVGVHQDGLVHVSELANRYVSDIKNHISTGDIVQVKVLSADPEQKRISLSMKKEAKPGEPGVQGKSGKSGRTGRTDRPGAAGKPRQSGQSGQSGRQGQKPPYKKTENRKPHKPATIDQLKNKYNTDGKKVNSNVKLKFSLKSLMKSGR